MILELAEQKALEYLKQVSNPLVPVDRLLRYLHQSEALRELTESDLLMFLRKHELFRVMDLLGDVAMQEAFAEEGISISPRVMLETRLPTKKELVEQLLLQLDTMVEALNHAMVLARDDNNPDRVHRLMGVLTRAQELRRKIEEVG